MVTKQPQAFLSYTRVDDEFFGGAITSLRKLLELGVQVVSGDRNFKIFQDIEGIEFGQQWQKELDKAISEVKFLIPVITPSFFQSPACCDELEKFIQREKTIGRDDLILPVYYVTTPLLEKSNLLRADPIAMEISKRQRYDWRTQADLPVTDPQVRVSVKGLAEKISATIERTDNTITHDMGVGRLPDKDFKKASEHIFSEERHPQANIEQKLILWVDDSPNNNTYERNAMEAYGIKFILTLSTEEALSKIESLYKSSKSYFDAIISDMSRPLDHRAGYTLLEALRARGNQIPYFIYMGSRDPKHIAEALDRGAQGTANMPGELIAMVIGSFRGVAKKN